MVDSLSHPNPTPKSKQTSRKRHERKWDTRKAAALAAELEVMDEDERNARVAKAVEAAKAAKAQTAAEREAVSRHSVHYYDNEFFRLTWSLIGCAGKAGAKTKAPRTS